ncbi:hypothetical protein RFI_34861 [Reticulomyxa filosa]|uniref:TRAF-type domain-containing protein n=1 Tax=Reticulomyxa filosa TaxID=46433 RepID=X6LN31_RETFI|nr:hypothetical protein RFI_34861 [Reticulomyxa filosa]|eukprot:ETO02557.1 hypothetical protein RFI_34861 [Reticulomyxa filosa]
MLLLNTIEEKHKQPVMTQLFSVETCLDKQWIQATNKASKLKHFVCAVCQQIAYPPTQLTCKEHENLSDAVVVGEYCLKQYLKKNTNRCPVGQHDNCTYVNVAILRNQINDLKVICPRQYQNNGCQYPVEGEEEGETTSTNGDKKVTKCAFKGELRQMQDHLDNHCHLKLLDCPFKPFGCNITLFEQDIQQHCTLQFELHLNLITNLVQSLSTTIQQKDTEIIQLKQSKPKSTQVPD